MKERSKVVERDLEEVNGRFDHHLREINHLKIREKEAKEKVDQCQEIGLVALMFFFELLFSYVSLTISLYVSFTDLFSIILFPYLLTTQDTQDKGEARFDSTNTGTV